MPTSNLNGQAASLILNEVVGKPFVLIRSARSFGIAAEYVLLTQMVLPVMDAVLSIPAARLWLSVTHCLKMAS